MTRSRWVLALVCVLAAVVHANTLANGFALDDGFIIEQNERVHGIAQLPEAVSSSYWPGDPPRIGMWRPLTSATMAVEWSLWGGHPAGFHAMNVLFHVVATGLVFLLLSSLSTSVLAAGMAAAVFAVHPVHVEAVANVVGRGELLAGIFYLAAAVVYLRAQPGWRTTAFIAASYFLALSAKEIAVTLPGALVLLELARSTPRAASGDPAAAAAGAPAAHPGSSDLPGFGDATRAVLARWRLYAVLTAVLGLYFGLRWLAIGTLVDGGDAPWLLNEPASTRIFTAIRTWPEFVRLMVFPADLIVDYSPAVIITESTLSPLVLFGVLTGVGAAVVAAAAWRQARLLSLGILWFALVVLPVSNLLFATGIILAERTLYIPSVGLAIGLLGLFQLVRRERPAWRPALVALLAVAVVAGSVRTWLRNPVWRSSVVALQNLVDEHPESFRAQWVSAEAAAEENPEEGLARLRMAVAMLPGSYNLRVDYAHALLDNGRYHAAAAQFDTARHDLPEIEEAQANYLTALMLADSVSAVLRHAPEVVELVPGSSRIRHEYTRALARTGQWRDAATQRRAAIERSPRGQRLPQWVNLAYLELRSDDTAAAARALERARALASDPARVPSLDDLRAVPTDDVSARIPLW